MFRNYLKIALRSLARHKLYSFINIFSLALGVAGCLLILLFVRDEWRFDRFHPHAENIYRLAVEENYGADQHFLNTITPIVLAPELRASYPEIRAAARLGVMRNLVRRDDVTFSERVHLTDDDFFAMFDFPLLRGRLPQLPAEVLLTPALVEKYFGTSDPLGQTLSIRLGDEFRPFTVCGIIAPAPDHSSIRFDMLIPFANSHAVWSERAHLSPFNVAVETYLQLPAGHGAADLAAKTPEMIRRLLGERYREGIYLLHFQPLTDIHLNTAYPAGLEPISDPAYSYLLAIVALLVFLIACINFTSLTLGRAGERAREVGVRKVVGAGRGQLIRQFWGETVLLSCFALLLGVLLAGSFLPTFNTLTGKSLALRFDAIFLGSMLLLMLLTGLVAGSYPAIFLSGFRPVEVLKGRIHIGPGGLFRRSLTVVQFALSVFLIICTLSIAGQLHYLQNKNLGFDKSQVLILPTGLPPQEGLPLYERLRNSLAGHQAIAGIGASAFALGEGWMTIGYDADDGTYRNFRLNVITPEFLETVGVELAMGRNFSTEIPSDVREGIIINQALADEYGWQAPLGERLPGEFPPHQVIGVVKDFNFESLHSKVEPLVLVLDRQTIFAGASDVSLPTGPEPEIAVRIRAGEMTAALAFIKDTWEQVAPGLPFSFTFLDETLNRQYRQEERLGSIVTAAAVFAVLIACLGLFGLAMLAAIRRTKEVGVRKVLGASVADIALLIARDFIKLVLLAILMAAPLAYLAVSYWLEGFAYRKMPGPEVFLLAGLLALGVALLTVSFQAVKAGLTDPARSLRYE